MVAYTYVYAYGLNALRQMFPQLSYRVTIIAAPRPVSAVQKTAYAAIPADLTRIILIQRPNKQQDG